MLTPLLQCFLLVMKLINIQSVFYTHKAFVGQLMFNVNMVD